MVNSFLKVKQFLEVEKIKLDKGHLFMSILSKPY